jgi:hypothetical protein
MDVIETRRADALGAVLRALRTGENTAAQEAAASFAPSVAYFSGGKEIAAGVVAVTERINGQWPLTPVLAQGEWAEPQASGDTWRVGATFPMVSTMQNYTLAVTFNGNDRIIKLDEAIGNYPRPTPVNAIPPVVRAAIDGALASGNPMVVAYTGTDGAPSLSLRGSVQVYGSLELCMWARDADSGLVRAARRGDPITFLYRNSARRITLMMRGRASVADDPAVRERIWSITPEVEKRHDTQRKGAALLIRMEEIKGNTTAGPVLVVPEPIAP